MNYCLLTEMMHSYISIVTDAALTAAPWWPDAREQGAQDTAGPGVRVR